MILKRARREGSCPGLGNDTWHFCLVLFVRNKLGGPDHMQEIRFKIHLFEAGSLLLPRGYSLVAASGLLIAVTSLVAEHRLHVLGLQ